MSLVEELFGVAEAMLSTVVDATAIVLPGFALIAFLALGSSHGCSTEKSALYAMRSDLRELARVEGTRRAKGLARGDLQYTADAADFKWSTGVELVYMRSTPTGFAVEVAYPRRAKKHCRVELVWGREPTPECDE